MFREINLNISIYNLVNEHPEIVDIMVNLGFKDILKPGMIESFGIVMTLKKGIKMKSLDNNLVRDTFNKYGYLIIMEDLK